MTASDFINAGVQIEDTTTAALYAETALDWIKRNTKLTVDKNNLNALPAGAKLFILKFSETMSTNVTVTSESLGGMSQSFSTEARNNLLYDLAFDFIGGDNIISQVEFIAAQSRWD